MQFSRLDLLVFAGYFLVIAGVAVAASRRERLAADYFLAGRSLPWWVIGVSLIASNISSEHFVGMAGSGAYFGLAIASYEWMAAITLVIVARWFLPRMLALGVTTMPEYLERRFDARSRRWLAVYMLLAYVFVAMATVLYSGALVLQTMFDLPLEWGIIMLAAFTGAYTAYGGLKAVVWSDVLQGTILIAGGILTTVVSLEAIGGWEAMAARAGDKLHTVLPLDHPELPWFGVFFGGLWIANIFYWGCNQFITQRTLAARSIAHGQYGIVFAAYLKFLIPFIVVIPGIVASVLFESELPRSDMAYPLLVERLLPPGLTGLIFAALMAAIMSSLDSMLNSAATVFTIDLYRPRRAVTEQRLIAVGRASTAASLVIAAVWAPFLGRFERVFSYIQEFWGLITPGVAVVFLAGLFWRRTTAAAAAWTLAATLPVTIATKMLLPGAAFLDQMWIAGVALAGLTAVRSLADPVPLAGAAGVETDRGAQAPAGGEILDAGAPPRRDRLFDALCVGVLLIAAALYWVFF